MAEISSDPSPDGGQPREVPAPEQQPASEPGDAPGGSCAAEPHPPEEDHGESSPQTSEPVYQPPSPEDPGALTLLTDHGGQRLGKSWRRAEDGSFIKVTPKPPLKFRHRAVAREPRGIRALAAGLEGKRTCPNQAIIRGSIRPEHANAPVVLRRRRARPADPSAPARSPNRQAQPAYFQEAPQGRSWICLDIDELDCPSHIDARQDLEAALRYALGCLPTPFRNATCYYQWSSGMGVGETAWTKIKIHLWFWLDEAVRDSELRRWANLDAEASVIDPHLFDPIQLHYVADPIFADDVEDPFSTETKRARSGILDGEREAVDLRGYIEPFIRSGARSGPRRSTEREALSAASGWAGISEKTHQFLELGAAEGERNDRLFAAACDVAGCGIPRTEAEPRFETAAQRCAPPMDPQEVRSTLDNAYAIPRDPATTKPSSSEDNSNDKSQATLLVELAHRRYTFGVNGDRIAFASHRDRPSIAYMFNGSRSSLKVSLASEFFKTSGKAATGSAIEDALKVLEGQASEGPPSEVHLRVAPGHSGGMLLDLGRGDGLVVDIRPGSWEVVCHCDVRFRRTALTAEMPIPKRGGSLTALRRLLNVSDANWYLLLAWMVASFFPQIAHPILLLLGGQGTGKSTAACMITRLFDTSTAQLQSPPRDPRQWAISASGAWGIVLDNVSHLPPWLSDALCKAVTGDGWVDRMLFTDSELTVLRFRRVIALTSIDPGALRGDLGDRLLLADLEPIEESRRRSEAWLWRAYGRLMPRLLGALLDLVAKVVEELPRVKLTKLPRLADFARILAALDRVLATQALDEFLGQRGRIDQEVIEGDAVATAVVALAAEVDGGWSGTATELLERLRHDNPPKSWPRSARGLSGALRRLCPALAGVGVEVVFAKDSGKDRTRLITIRKAELPRQGDLFDDGDGRSSDGCGRYENLDRPTKTASNHPIGGVSDGSDGSDGCFPKSEVGPGGDEAEHEPKPAQGNTAPAGVDGGQEVGNQPSGPSEPSALTEVPQQTPVAEPPFRTVSDGPDGCDGPEPSAAPLPAVPVDLHGVEPDQWRDLVEEKAACLEFEANLPRSEAEALAPALVRERLLAEAAVQHRHADAGAHP